MKLTQALNIFGYPPRTKLCSLNIEEVTKVSEQMLSAVGYSPEKANDRNSAVILIQQAYKEIFIALGKAKEAGESLPTEPPPLLSAATYFDNINSSAARDIACATASKGTNDTSPERAESARLYYSWGSQYQPVVSLAPISTQETTRYLLPSLTP